jgi:tRNA A37 N6-isopentenylltransferase MiaA
MRTRQTRRRDRFPWRRCANCGINATRQLAKRQITWLRSCRQRQVVACDRPDALAQVLARSTNSNAQRPAHEPRRHRLAKRYGDTAVFANVSLRWRG